MQRFIKNTVIVFFILFLATGCSTTKEDTKVKSDEKDIKKVVNQEKQEQISSVSKIDTTKISQNIDKNNSIQADSKNSKSKEVVSLETQKNVKNTSVNNRTEDIGEVNNSNNTQEKEVTTKTIENQENKELYKEGTYSGTGMGKEAPIEVEVTVSQGKISGLAIVSHQDTAGFPDQALRIISQNVISKQSGDVDAVSGATKSSQGIIQGIKDAINKAKLEG